jgi:HD-GYP domain-containing protein (c-di-GMP phosphodiesterase class II)
MTLSQALAILARFRDDGHIDPDLCDVFVNSGIHRRYAEAFPAPNQVDC